MSLQQFIRRPLAKQLSGFGDTEFDNAVKEGRFPKPDGYLGPRSPFWLESTIVEWQQQHIGKPRPIETRPSRRRAEREAATAGRAAA